MFARRTIAASTLVMSFPSVLFMTALFVRNLQPQRYEPARSAQRIVTWYATHGPFSLWALLVILPLAVVLTGGTALAHQWQADAGLRAAAASAADIVRRNFATLVIACATLACAAILAIVAVHMASD